jgi:phenylpropionate dioxygenase-like ring-hydroxylating dioxygenase large terminal subunit
MTKSASQTPLGEQMSLTNADASLVNRRAFFDQDVFDEEMQRIFRKSWQFVAHESEVREPGDYVTRVLAGDPVIVVRSEAGGIRVLLNACRHRGAQLCAADAGNTSHFRCSYHGWTYTNQGELRGVPARPTLYPNGFDRSSYGLRSARVEVFCGLVFATFDASVPPLRDYLGDLAWYIESVFGKCEMEVVGPPTRRLGFHNWKTGVENWTGDGYHNAVTHKTVFDIGVVAPAPLIEQAAEAGAGEPVWRDAGEPYLTCQFATENGHGGKTMHLAADYPEPTFFGYEKHLWPEFVERLTPEQADFASRSLQVLATAFPNFSFAQLCYSYVGDGLPPTTMTHIRAWVPISATQTEAYQWVVVPKNASDDWKRRSQRAYTRTLGVGGLLEIDDLQNWTGMTQSNRGAEGLSSNHDYTALYEAPANDTKWPGDVYPGNLHDVVFRSVFKEWAERMNDVPEAASRSGGDA